MTYEELREVLRDIIELTQISPELFIEPVDPMKVIDQIYEHASNALMASLRGLMVCNDHFEIVMHEFSVSCALPEGHAGPHCSVDVHTEHSWDHTKRFRQVTVTATWEAERKVLNGNQDRTD